MPLAPRSRCRTTLNLEPFWRLIHKSTDLHRERKKEAKKEREKTTTTSSLFSIKILPGYLHLGATTQPSGNLVSWGNGAEGIRFPVIVLR